MSAKIDTPTSKARARRLTSEQRRAVLLEAAVRVFAARGFHAASINDIAREAGITKPVIYHHFASKQILHKATFQHYAEQLLATAAARGTRGNPKERFGDLVLGMFEFAHANPAAWQLLLGDSNDTETAELQQQLRDTGTHVSAQRLLAEPAFTAAAGLSRRKTAEAAAQLARSAVDGLITWSLQHPSIPTKALTATATSLIWDGLSELNPAKPAGQRQPEPLPRD